ncbi:MAG: hypothetical protein ACKO37_01230 [Vampirovibrionales bacterium]
MGLAASAARQYMLTARNLDLQFQLQMIAQAKQQLSQTSSQMFNLSDSLDPELPFSQLLQERVSNLFMIDKALEMQSQRIQTAMQMVQAELESVKKMVQNNIKSAMNYMS